MVTSVIMVIVGIYLWYNVPMSVRLSKFKQRKAQIDADMAPIERDFYFWLEHVTHWYLLLIALVAILGLGYALFDSHSTLWAATVLSFGANR